MNCGRRGQKAVRSHRDDVAELTVPRGNAAARTGESPYG
jgi:hypothetical protein